jgi:MoxR-like ATPase
VAKSKDYAVRLLETLQDNMGSWLTTRGLLRTSGIKESMQAMQLKILHELARVGTVFRISQKGSLYWKLATKNWNPIRPMDHVEGMTILSDDGKEKDIPSPDLPDGADKGETPTSGTDLRTVKALHLLTESVATLQKLAQRQAGELDELRDKYARANGVITIHRWDGEIVKLKDVAVPAIFQDVLDLAVCKENIMLVGPAGCGKTHVAEMVAKAMKLDFGSLSCTSGMSETHLLGRSTPDFHEGKSKFQGTEFLRIYENGGVFLMDEVDAADSNLLLALNSALANGYANVPNRPNKPRAIKHENFVMIATANTYGRGANRVYAGRNQLDGSTLDRFCIGTIECDYDKSVEEKLCPDVQLLQHFWTIRKRVEAAGLRRIVSTRFLIQAYKMRHAKGVEWSLEKIVGVFFNGWSEDEKNKAWVVIPSSDTPDPSTTESHQGTTDAKAEFVGGVWKCSEHGDMIRMSTGRGWKCCKSGKYDAHSKKWSGCNCCSWDSK